MNNTILKTALHYILPLVIISSLLFFLPFTPNYFTSIKQLVLILSVAALLIVLGIEVLTKKELSLSHSSANLPLLLFAVAIALNFFTNKEGWLEALVGRGSLYLAGAALAYFASLLSGSSKLQKWVIYSLVISTTALALHSLMQLTFLYKIDRLPAFMASRAFTPTGNPTVSLTLLIIGAITTFYYASKTLKGSLQYLFFVMATIQTIAAVAYLSLMLPGNELTPAFLPYQASWSVTLDALKAPRSIFFGVGLANFSSLFNAVKPLSLNAGAYWNLTPTSATSEFLHLLATTGLLGFITFLLLIISVFHRSSHNPSIFLVFTLSAISLLLTPASIPVLILFFISLGLLSGRETRVINFNRSTSLTLGVLALLLAGSVSFYSIRAYAAENHMFQAQKALAANDGKTVYEQSVAAIRLMPALSGYRLSYSQVNLSLASALSQKKDLTDAERSQVTTLVQQSINEAKVAATLHQSDVRTWQNLGVVYRNLINVADGADQFAVSAYAQAVALSPGDPALRVEFGGLLFQLSGAAKDKDTKNTLLSRAVQEFQTAVQLKSDYANAYYNLSKALEVAGNTQGAYDAMQKAVASLDPNSPDVSKVTSELETLKGKLPKPSPTPSPSPSSSEISTPSPLPSPLKGGPIDLPAESPLPTPNP